MSTVECPQCGLPATISDGNRRSADDFCETCDYPLFWVRERYGHPPDEPSNRGRLPGVSGRAGREAWPCPHCAEPNPPATDVCTRCGGVMAPTPPPPPEPPEPIEPLPIAEPPPVPAERASLWKPLSVALMGAVLALALTLVVLR